jgi:hypothetical protein
MKWAVTDAKALLLGDVHRSVVNEIFDSRAEKYAFKNLILKFFQIK